jgi:hypothetical protein
MNTYAVPYERETLAALRRLADGVISIGIAKDFPHSKDCTACYLETAAGSWIQLQATEEGLEFKFEVFPLQARHVTETKMEEQHPLILTSPVTVTPLVADSWLDSTAPTGPTVGSDPVMQFVGQPGSAPSTASAICHYLGGVELVGANGQSLVVATGSFPYSMHVSGFNEDTFFNRNHYVGMPGEA